MTCAVAATLEKEKSPAVALAAGKADVEIVFLGEGDVDRAGRRIRARRERCEGRKEGAQVELIEGQRAADPRHGFTERQVEHAGPRIAVERDLGIVEFEPLAVAGDLARQRDRAGRRVGRRSVRDHSSMRLSDGELNASWPSKKEFCEKLATPSKLPDAGAALTSIDTGAEPPANRISGLADEASIEKLSPRQMPVAESDAAPVERAPFDGAGKPGHDRFARRRSRRSA